MRVVTWNVWWRFGPWRRRREAIRAVLAAAGPDLVGLQEVWGDERDNLAGWLAAELGLHWTWAPFASSARWRDRAPGDGCDVGVAVLSRWPIADREVLSLPAPGGAGDGRTALYVLADAPDPVPFFTTHLEAPPWASGTRMAQVRELVPFVAAHQGAAGRGPIVTGDLNAVPDSDEVRLLGGVRTAPVVPQMSLQDVWGYADPADPGTTWRNGNPYVKPGNPDARIDYIHVGGPHAVTSVGLLGERPVDGVWPSDHVAVVADLAEAPDTAKAPA
ncbi:endonuclease/exonuclease/phosphatase family protein [Actinomadura flavalba]|uniref:endonuclease/exonuclease/phosphatase family protein n=1 Tax=Actinomadura flavalba TaxID=1120938 RepID=UPI000376F28B|nr:endonuclease/exonuclease/phosphatase family protein [Actinomadura flavalba]